MKAMISAFVVLAAIAVPVSGQIPEPGYWDKRCPEKDLFTDDLTVSGRDFIEVRHLPSYGNAPVYTIRIYGDGRLVWQGGSQGAVSR